MVGHLIQFFGKLTLAAWVFILMPFVLVGIFFLIRHYVVHPVIRWVSYFVIVLAIFRIIMFHNPVAWATYNKMLPLKSIDWRHHDVISSEIGKFLKPPEGLKYLAVGSSQTSVIFNRYSREHNDFALFALAGLSPLDFYTYRKEIVRQKPRYVLLYISEFDIARQPELASSKWSPFSLGDIAELRAIIDTVSYFEPGDKQIIYDVFFGKYFPEYRYAFVFKDITDKLLDKDKLLNLTPPTLINDSISLNVHLKYLSGLSEKYIPFNMFYLKKTIKYLNKKNIRVIMVEGQYNPLAYQPHNLALNKEVRSLLQDFTKTNPVNVFLSRDEIPNFVLQDYRDGYHVNEFAGLKFAEILIRELNSKAL